MDSFPVDSKSFVNRVFTTGVDVLLEGCTVSWNPYKTFLLSILFETTLKLEGHNILGVSYDVTNVSIRFWIEWLNKVHGEFKREQRHLELVQKAQSMQTAIMDMKKQVDEIEKGFAQVEAEMITKGMTLSFVTL